MYKKNDHYSQSAKKEGYAARSVYKLQQMQRRWTLIPQGAKILELGAAPGSWSAYLLKEIGASGRLIAVDLKPLKIANKRLSFYQEDFTSTAFLEKVTAQHGRFDILVSDAAPSTTGQRLVDTARSENLVCCIMEAAPFCLKQGGTLLFKIFEGGSNANLIKVLKSNFLNCRSFRPAAVRASSCETYIIAQKMHRMSFKEKSQILE